MKLYTESQIREALDNEDFAYIANIVIAQMQPIELPTIDEIIDNAPDETLPLVEFIAGARWMKEQILKQNK